MALSITLKKTGTNSENAVVGDLTLLDGAAVVRQSTAFSGGNSFSPIDDGTYRIRLDIRGDEDSNHANTDGTLQPFFGIQKVGTNVPDDDGNSYDMQVEWGTLRARLNPSGGAPDRGDYLHGKKRPRDYTHGCICERSETVLSYLWNLASPPSRVDLVVSGGKDMDLETIVPKNAGQRIANLLTKGRIGSLVAMTPDGFRIRFEPDIETAYRTSSDTVQMALTTAMTLNVGVELELFEGTDVVRRLAPFDVLRPGEPVRPRTIRRLATQRNPETGNNWLEVFVADEAGQEIVYLARDSNVQRLCHLAAVSKRHLDFTYEGNNIVSVSTGSLPVVGSTKESVR